MGWLAHPHHHHHTTETFKALTGNPGSWFSVWNFILIQLESRPPKNIENNFKKNEKWKTTSKKMEDDLNFKAVRLSLFNNKNLQKKWFGTIEIDLVIFEMICIRTCKFDSQKISDQLRLHWKSLHKIHWFGGFLT